MTFSHFIQFYKNLMFDAQKSVRAMSHPLQLITACPQPAQPIPPFALQVIEQLELSFPLR